jgi:hypothetical protein
MKVNNGECRAEAVMNTFIYYVLFSVYKKLVGILGEKNVSNNTWIQCVTILTTLTFLPYALLEDIGFIIVSLSLCFIIKNVNWISLKLGIDGPCNILLCTFNFNAYFYMKHKSDWIRCLQTFT